MLSNTSKAAFLFLVTLFSLSLAGCGTSNFFPTLSYTLPTSITSASTALELELASTKATAPAPQPVGDFLLLNQVQRMDRIVENINNLLTRLNEDGVDKTGTFSGKGPGKNVKGKISAITDTTYAYEATICVDSTVLDYIRWNKDKNKVEAYHNFGANPIRAEWVTNLIAKVIYDSSDSANTTLNQWVHGTPWALPNAGLSTNNTLTEYVAGTRSSAGAHTIKGVSSWDDGSANAWTYGNGYFTGQLASDGSGGWAGYLYMNGDGGICNTAPASIDEATPSSWLCHAHEIGNASVYTNLTTPAAATYYDTANLDLIGIAAATNLTAVAMPSGLSCE